MKKHFIALILLGLFALPNKADANVRTPSQLMGVVEGDQATVEWFFNNTDGGAEGYRIEVAPVQNGSIGDFTEFADQDGALLDTQATIDIGQFEDDALFQVRVTALNATAGDSTPSEALYLKKYPKSYTENFENQDLGSINGQNGWIETGTLLPDMQIVNSGTEDGQILRNTTGSYTYTQHKLTQGRTGENAKIRIKVRRLSPDDWESPMIWIHGQSDRTDSSTVNGPKYGFLMSDFIGDEEMWLMGFDDANEYMGIGLDFVSDFSFDYNAWHMMEVETIRVANGLLVRGTLLDEQGNLVDQVGVLENPE